MKTLALYVLLFLSVASYASTVEPVLKALNEKAEITILLPASYATDKTKHYPVIYVLDGQLNAQLVQSMNARLAASAGSYEHIVVGIESADRLKDFAPSVNMDPRGPIGAGGGADKFLDYLEIELIPRIARQYRTTDHKTIAGHSIAGLLVVHSFHSRPQLFQAHLAFSPAIWWGERETANEVKKYMRSGISKGNFLYLNIGNESGEMRAVYDAFVDSIVRNRSLDLMLNLDEFNTAAHGFTLSAGLYNALRGLYKYQQATGK